MLHLGSEKPQLSWNLTTHHGRRLCEQPGSSLWSVFARYYYRGDLPRFERFQAWLQSHRFDGVPFLEYMLDGMENGLVMSCSSEKMPGNGTWSCL